MAIGRIDLADIGSPERLAIEIFKHEPDLVLPVPIEELCRKLDITNIIPLTTEGFEGGLITDRDKCEGVILFNTQSPIYRQRFTIAHELGHFLIASHIPTSEGKFLCSQEDMLKLPDAEQKQRYRMEIEANLFASRLLIPLHLLRKDSAKERYPTLVQVIELAARYNVSKEAMCRAYVGVRDEPTAVMVCLNGKVLRVYRNNLFPFLTTSHDQNIPSQSAFYKGGFNPHEPSEIIDVDAGVWIDVIRGKKSPNFYEQFCILGKGYSLVMLSLDNDEDDEYDPEADKTSKQRYQDRIAKYGSY